jgi:hypothetical protein
MYYLHKLDTGFQGIIETEEQEKVFFHGEELGELKHKYYSVYF